MKSRLSPVAAVLLAGCASVPKGPDVAVMPGPGKSLEQFEADDHVCRDYAGKSVKTSANQAGAGSVGKGAVIGTLLGAAAGALLGMGHGGAVAGGAGMGLIIGSAEGAQGAGQAEQQVQRRYDIAYDQCMTTKGNPLPPPPVSYYRYRNAPQRIIIYQSPPPGPPPELPPGPPE
jgi:uncharacterized protein YcfJ